MRFALSPLLLLVAALPAAAQSHIAPTTAKSPADERKAFKLPPGFTAQLVASEPDIGKPIQIAFDAKGRLWVTTSRHYPFPATENPSDKLYILSDFGPDGKAKKVSVFADNLNIPAGILPLPDCNSCLASSAGEVVKLTDTDGDGKADKKEAILTGFGHVDTHGMTNSFTLMPDGWVYATHGFRNTSVVKGTDGSTITMNSGNTYRFRPDGSHVEHWTYGQVNPFGMTVDPWFNLYTADCHSKPITQLIRGAHYSSFGKPHDGLGFAPHVTRHDHGSTALCGLAWYDAGHFPKEWNGCMFLGNVVTNRINADRIVWHGSTPEAKELPDFLVSADPWFRPTDIKLGPDGALYVADFYNRIIGHYEVDLHHPLRDKDHGRVWRIVWTGLDGKAKLPTMPDLMSVKIPDLYKELGDPNLSVRLLATQQLIRRYEKFSAYVKEKGEIAPRKPVAGVFFLHSVWMTANLNMLANDNEALRCFVLNFQLRQFGQSPFQAVGLLQKAASLSSWGKQAKELREQVARCLTDSSAHVRRSAVDALAVHPHADNVAPLVKVIANCPKDDTHLLYAARLALRNTLRDAPGAWDAAAKADPAIIGDVAAAVPSKEAADYSLRQVKAGHAEPRFCEHVGRYGDDAQAAAVVAAIQAKPASVFAVQSLVRGVQARGGKVPAGTTAIAEVACTRALKNPNAFTVAAATDLAAHLKLADLFEPLAQFAASKHDVNQRGSALAALMALDPAKATPILGKVLTSPNARPALRTRAAKALAESNQPAAHAALVAALQTVPARLAVTIAVALADSPRGANTLLDAVQQGKASARLLQMTAVALRLHAIDGGKLKPRVEALTRGLPSADARLAEVLKTRAANFRTAKPDAKRGQAVFTQHCAACHQIGGQGAKIGPQLDGIGNRGLERVLEDVLDSNRNVDAAFRATVVNTLDGRTITGLVLREEGQVLVLADSAGKEVRIEAKDIDKRTSSPLSPMPANFDTAIPEADFQHLIAYLLAQRAKQ